MFFRRETKLVNSICFNDIELENPIVEINGKSLFELLFKEGDLIVFACHKEETLLTYSEAKRLKKQIFNFFEIEGEIQNVNTIDDQLFNVIFYFTYDAYIFNSIYNKCWMYFYGFSFFRIDLSQKRVIKNKPHVLFRRDPGGVKLIEEGITDHIFIKELGGGDLNLSYHNSFILPFEIPENKYKKRNWWEFW
ncbi:hypothetical protein RCC89_17145 [Cytophagaceae bacterium ABcell3]|nr:hypothetical protein RCC89_17145 [Cytophagaceae bacterium ABcell3]